MEMLIGVLEGIDDFSLENTEKIVLQWIQDNNLGMGAVMNAFRLAIVGISKGPHMFDITTVIGKEETIARLKRAIEVLK